MRAFAEDIATETAAHLLLAGPDVMAVSDDPEEALLGHHGGLTLNRVDNGRVLLEVRHVEARYRDKEHEPRRWR